jgi:hypothetical protein
LEDDGAEYHWLRSWLLEDDRAEYHWLLQQLYWNSVNCHVKQNEVTLAVFDGGSHTICIANLYIVNSIIPQ